MTRKSFLIFGFIILLFITGCNNSETDKVVKEINKLYKIEILEYAQVKFCKYEGYWDGDDYRGCFELTTSAEEFMDAFPQVIYKFVESEEDYFYYNGWLSSKNYSDMPDFEEKINQAIKMLSIFDVNEIDKESICWYNTLTYNNWLVLDIKNHIVYFREYTY